MNPPRKAIVIVDDEKSYVDLLSQMLTDNLGCTVVTFTRPLDALAALPRLDVGIVVTDYYMPQMNGFEFIREASCQLPGVPFVLISGHTLEVAASLPDTGGPLRAILAKPFGWRRLADEIARLAPEVSASFTKAEANPTSV